MDILAELTLTNVSSTDPKSSIAKIWWTGRKIESNNPLVYKRLANSKINGTTIKDGLEFFNNIPLLFLNGYIAVKRTK